MINCIHENTQLPDTSVPAHLCIQSTRPNARPSPRAPCVCVMSSGQPSISVSMYGPSASAPPCRPLYTSPACSARTTS